MNRRIGIDIRCLLDQPMSGVGVYTKTFVERVLQADPTTTYVLFISGKHSSRHTDIAKHFHTYNNAEIYHLSWPNKLLNTLWRLRTGPKLDQLLNVRTLWMPQYNFIRISTTVKLIVTCHDISFALMPYLYSLKGRLWHWFVQPKRLYKNATHVIAVSHQTKFDLVTWSISHALISVIEPITPLPRFQLSQSKTNTVTTFPEKYFVYIGTLDPRKNIIGLLEGYLLYKQKYKGAYALVLAGRLGWHKSNYYNKLLNIIRQEKTIHYLGYVSDYDKYTLLHKAQGAFFASLYEGFGFPVIEAMYCECPVIISHVSSLPEIAQDASLVINPYDKNEIAMAFAELETNQKTRTRLITRGVQIAKQWESTSSARVQKLISVLQNHF